MNLNNFAQSYFLRYGFLRLTNLEFGISRAAIREEARRPHMNAPL